MSNRFLRLPRSRAALTAMAVAFCVPSLGTAASGNVIEEPPAWKSEDGRKEIWRELAHWYVENDMPAQALEMVARLNAIGESTADIRLVQGEALMRQGLPDEALPVLEGVIKERPKDARPLQSIGILYADIGETDKAVAMLFRAVELDGTHGPTRNNLGFLLLAGNRCEEAIPHLEAAVKIDPATNRYRNNLAFALVCVGDAQRALQLFRSTGEEATARYNMGVAYERLDKVPSAILQYQQVLDFDPTHEGASQALERLANPSPPPDDASTPGEPR